MNVKSDLGTSMAAFGASLPFTYSWRVLAPTPTSATQMLLDAS